MTVFRSIVGRVLVCIVLPVAAASGQRLSSTFDASVQAWGATGARRYAHDGGFAAEVFGARRLRPSARGALIVGGAAALHGTIGSGDVCRIPAPPAPGEPVCLPDAPSFASLAALGGVEGTFGVIARLVGGPAAFHAGKRGTALGFQARADLATPRVRHLSLVVSARGTVIPNIEGDALRYVAFGLGVGIR
jgi:hypothetical protein